MKKIRQNINKYNPSNICLSGGVSLNCLMTGKMLDWWPNINIYADPIPYDGGLCLGTSRYLWHHILDNPRIKYFIPIHPILFFIFYNSFIIINSIFYNILFDYF